MANVPLTPKQARKKLHRIAEQYGLDIGEIELIPIERIREALHRFDIGLLPSAIDATLDGASRASSSPDEF